jgi:hypothetical protein
LRPPAVPSFATWGTPQNPAKERKPHTRPLERRTCARTVLEPDGIVTYRNGKPGAVTPVQPWISPGLA